MNIMNVVKGLDSAGQGVWLKAGSFLVQSPTCRPYFCMYSKLLRIQKLFVGCILQSTLYVCFCFDLI